MPASPNIVISKSITINPSPLIKGQNGVITISFKNTGTANFGGSLAVSIHSSTGTFINDIETFTGTILPNAEKQMGKLSGTISTAAGTYKIIAKKKDASSIVWTNLQEKIVEIKDNSDGSTNVPNNILSPVVGQLHVGSNVIFNEWSFNQHKSGAHTSSGGIGDCDDTFAWDANLYISGNNDADANKPVYPVADGKIVSINSWGGTSSGQVLVEHTTNGKKWYSGYLHMSNIKKSGSVTTNDVIGNISSVGATNNHLHFAVYYLNSSNKLVSVNRSLSNRIVNTPKIEVTAAPNVTPNPLINGSPGNMNVTFKNTGTAPWTGCLYLSFKDNNGVWQSAAQTSSVTIQPNATRLLERTPNANITTAAGNYTLVPRYQAACSGAVTELAPVKTFTVQNQIQNVLTDEGFSMDIDKISQGIVIYSKDADKVEGEVIFVIDYNKGANIKFNLGKETSPNSFYKQTVDKVYKENYTYNLVAVTNGQFFENAYNINLSSSLSLPVKINGTVKYDKVPFKTTSGICLEPNKEKYFQELGLVSNGVYVENLFNRTEYNNLQKDCKEKAQININSLQGMNVIVGKYLNVADDMDFKDHFTLITGIGNSSPINKIAIYVGNNSKHGAALLLRKLGATYTYDNVTPKRSVIETSIMQLDGGGSSQAYGISKGSSKWFKRSDAKLTGAPRTIPQTISIFSANSSNTRSTLDSLETISSDTVNTQLIYKSDHPISIKAYPNPTENGLVKLQLEGMQPDDVVEIRITDEMGNISGATIKGTVAEINNREIQVSNGVTSNSYIIHAFNTNTQQHYSFRLSKTN